MGPPHTSGATRTRGEQEKCTSCNMADWQEEHECLLAKALAAVVGAAVAAAVRAADSLPPPRHREREREREMLRSLQRKQIFLCHNRSESESHISTYVVAK